MTRRAAAVAAVLLSVVLPGCASHDEPDRARVPKDSPAAPPTALPQSDAPYPLDAAALSPDITNPWFPLKPATRWTYRETDEEGAVQQGVMTVTDRTRRIADGAEARVVRDTVSQDGQVVEDTFDWYAQDADGTVWYLGEDTAEFEDGRLTNRDGSFEAGVKGGLEGIIMPAEPTVGQAYREEYLSGVAEDHGKVLALDGRAEVPAGRYDHLVKIADTTPLEPDVLEQKYYARDVGVVLTVDTRSRAREVLVSMTTVTPAEARRAATVPLGRRY